MSNFAFLSEWPAIQGEAQSAEALVHHPIPCVLHCRRALEAMVQWLYAHDEDLEPGRATKLYHLLDTSSFRANMKESVWKKAHYVRKIGNTGAHHFTALAPGDHLHCLEELHHVLYWLYYTYSETFRDQVFDRALLPAKQGAQPDASAQKALEAENEKLIEQIEALKDAAVQARVKQRKQQPRARDPHDYKESETRTRFIDRDLRRAGWDLEDSRVQEYPVEGMPKKDGTKGPGKVDYVLWGDDGLPLAVVEAKRFKVDPKRGREQARDYANCLQEMTGQRPVIFYTNGAETWLWDDFGSKGYLAAPPRRVSGFYNRDQLQRMVQRRTGRKDLAKFAPDERIIDRLYQIAAVRKVCEHFGKNFRRALLVMATGTGKTRTTVALVKLMQQAGWVKNVLFLADRVALVKQAQSDGFKPNLPDTGTVILDSAKHLDGLETQRICLATFPTMANIIEKQERGDVLFTPGHFDLIVVDEAHRSIYQKFRIIFDYFDARVLGLTATPRDEIDRNTYNFFELSDHQPTYAYGLDEAVEEGHLVNYALKKGGTGFQRKGIKYTELSEEEQEDYENRFPDDKDGDLPKDIDAKTFNRFITNQDTVDKVIQNLMGNGIKVQGGDRLGKSIIFARDHNHAVQIEERFNALNPHLGGTFARVIDNVTDPNNALVEAFSKKEEPVLAISVDKLDTGIDVRPLVNLVFFKPVRSKTKFWQMIGRGTRKCEDLFGPGRHKTHFLIFDHCGNFDFFEVKPEGKKAARVQQPLRQRIFDHRLQLACRLARSQDPAQQALGQQLFDALHDHVSALDPNHFQVRSQLERVRTYQQREAWNSLVGAAGPKLKQLADALGDLPGPQLDYEPIRRFDHLILSLQLALPDKQERWAVNQGRLMEIVEQLRLKREVHGVAEQLPLMDRVLDPQWWEEVDVLALETVRQGLRELTTLLDPNQVEPIYTDYEDSPMELQDGNSMVDIYNASFNLKDYRKSVIAWLEEQKEEVVAIHKLFHNQPLTRKDFDTLEKLIFNAEVVGDKEKLFQSFRIFEERKEVNLGLFVRSVLGLDPQAVDQAFAKFTNAHQLTGKQNDFMKLLRKRLSKIGTIELADLLDDPFSYIHEGGPSAVFGQLEPEFIACIEELNAQAMPPNGQKRA